MTEKTVPINKAKLFKELAQKKDLYRNGGEGMIQWVEDNVWTIIQPVGSSISQWCPMNNLPDTINPETGRSYTMMWEHQKKILRESLVMKDGKFVHRKIVLCWMRGEGKTFIGPCLINLWKFFCFPKQKIVLAANSQGQTKFITFDMMKSIIKNSPRLDAILGPDDLVDKEIRMRDATGDIASRIMCGTSHTGVYSGATGYAFSEMFEAKNPEFYNQLDGSMRIQINALGVIDSTVAPKDHVLYMLYQNFLSQKDPTVYFSYRCSLEGDHKDYWHPNYTQKMLDSYRHGSVLNSFARYFLNLWSAGSDRLIEDEFIEASYYIGNRMALADKTLLINDLTNIKSLELKVGQTAGNLSLRNNYLSKIEQIRKVLMPVDEKYVLRYSENACYADPEVLTEMGKFYDTEWAVLAGLDRSDPTRHRGTARTILTTIAKGMIGSKTHRDITYQSVTNYIYLLLYVGNLTGHSLDEIKGSMNFVNGLYGGVDMFTIEKPGAWDLGTWGVDNDIPVMLIAPSSNVQKEAFTEYQLIYRSGRIKSPKVPLPGSYGDDIIREELQHFKAEVKESVQTARNYTIVFGSDEKHKVGGAQDDSIYSKAWAIYGGRGITVEQFRERGGDVATGFSYEQEGLLGDYGN